MSVKQGIVAARRACRALRFQEVPRCRKLSKSGDDRSHRSVHALL